MTRSKVVFDPYSQEFFDNPYEVYRRMREEAPVYYNDELDFYALTRHADVSSAYKDFQTYSSSRGMTLEMVKAPEPPAQKSIIFLDPPEHRHMRSLVNKVFTPRAIGELKPMVSEQIDRYIARANPDKFDVVRDFAGPFPIEVVARMLGVEPEYRQKVREWLDLFMHREPGSYESTPAGIQAFIDMATMYNDLVQERRSRPQDDMLSGLIVAKVQREDGSTATLNDTEIIDFSLLLGGAGAETVTKLIGNAAVILARNPEQWQKLLDDRSKIPAAVEEVLRYEAPSQYNVRYTLSEVHLHGVTIPAGKPVFLINGAANRDPDAFTDAETFDIDRDRTEALNIGMGYGIHSCLGAALARMESAIAIERLLDFIPRYELVEEGLKRVEMSNVAGWSNVPVRALR